MRTYASQLRDNLGRYAYQFVDFSPLPDPLAVEINPTKAAVFSRLFQWLRIPVENPETIATPRFDLQYINPLDEDTSWFGPLAVFLIPAVVVQAYQGLRRRRWPAARTVDHRLRLCGRSERDGGMDALQGQILHVSSGRPASPLGLPHSDPHGMACGLTLCIVALGLVAMFAPTLNDPALKNIGWGDAFSPSRMKIDWPKDFQYFMVAKNISTNGVNRPDRRREFSGLPLLRRKLHPLCDACRPRGVRAICRTPTRSGSSPISGSRTISS